MIRSRQISAQALGGFSRSLARMLEAGVDVRKSLQTASQQSSDSRLSASAQRLQKAIASGSSLAESIEAEGELYPPLFRDLVNVGELTGSAPEVFASLAKYYEARVQQVREFRPDCMARDSIGGSDWHCRPVDLHSWNHATASRRKTV